MRNILTYILITLSTVAFAQNAEVANLTESTETAKKPIEFNHLPVFLIKLKPTSMLGVNNTIQYGLEIAPPFGKFSFNFDYGTGKGGMNLNKYIRQNQKENKNTEFSGEVRMYFSDWYPFYAMDKKPFGRYYAIEYFNGNYQRQYGVATPMGGTTLPAYAQFDTRKIKETNQGINFKFGKHFQISRYLFIDGFMGLGLGQYKVNYTDVSDQNLDTIPLHLSFLSNRKVRMPGTKGLFISKTIGLRLAFPI